MTRLLRRARTNERGAALILAIAFLVLAGGIGASVLASISSGLKGGAVLQQARNREYAADGAIEAGIAEIRDRMVNPARNLAVHPCGTPAAPLPLAPQSVETPAVTIQVDCQDVSTLTTTRYLQRNFVLTAHCATSQSTCPDTSAPIIRAQVNFASPSIITDPSITVSRTYIQSWSVNG